MGSGSGLRPGDSLRLPSGEPAGNNYRALTAQGWVSTGTDRRACGTRLAIRALSLNWPLSAFCPHATVAPMHRGRQTHVLYEIELAALVLQFANGTTLDFTFALTTGRANYIMFQALVAHFTGLIGNSEGGKADLRDDAGHAFEVKSYKDPLLHSAARDDLFHTAASSTFGPNNHGPTINRLVRAGDYKGALRICMDAGYGHNDYYVYTNTAQFGLAVPFRYFILPVADVLALLSTTDPRLVSRRQLLAALSRTERLA